MAETPPQIPSSTDRHGLSETNNSPHQSALQPTPQESLNNQQYPIEQQRSIRAVSEEDQEFFKKIRGWLMIVAILAAGSSYQAGLDPPGSVWGSDDQGHAAGNPVMRDKSYNRYHAFFYCNSISFFSSLVIIIFMMNKHFYRDPIKIKVLEITLVLDLFSFMAAYVAGSCRKITSSIYVFLLLGGVFVYVISFVHNYAVLRNIASKMPCARRCMRTRDQPVVVPIEGQNAIFRPEV